MYLGGDSRHRDREDNGEGVPVLPPPTRMCFVPQVLAAVVVLSWGFLLYGARVAAQRQLESGLPAQGWP